MDSEEVFGLFVLIFLVSIISCFGGCGITQRDCRAKAIQDDYAHFDKFGQNVIWHDNESGQIAKRLCGF